MRNKKLQLTIVFLIAFVALSINVASTSIGSGWIDPTLHYGAQDEATYTHEAIRMLKRGEWMTPAVLGRWVLEKPPLLIWMSAVSMKLFGINSFAPRVPALLAGAVIVTLCFAIAQTRRGTVAGVAAALLCLANQLLFTMSRHVMTDIVVAAATLIAMAAFIWDPQLEVRRSRFLLALAIAGGILSKSVAGLLPVFAALLASIAGRRLESRRATLSACATGVLIACPWFLYQLIAHREWLLADMRFQLLTIGVRPQTSLTTHLGFYLQRLLYAAPAALVLWMTAVPSWFSALLRRDEIAVVLACFFGVLAAALLVFRFQSATYLTPLLPVLVLIAAIYSPLLDAKLAIGVVAAIAAAFCVKAANPEQLWGISYDPSPTVPAIAALSQYCEERRGNDLYILGVDDQLYGLALPLTHLHYGWIDPGNSIAESRPHLEYLGILQHAGGPDNHSLYANRLRAWGVHSTESLATGVIAATVEDLATLVISHAESDFLVSPEIARSFTGRDQHDARLFGPGYVLLQSRTALPAAAPAWTCHM